MQPCSPTLPSSPRTTLEVVYAKDHPLYRDLPALCGPAASGKVTTRWRLSLRERLNVLLRGNVFVQVLTFHQPLQPIKVMADEPALEECI